MNKKKIFKKGITNKKNSQNWLQLGINTTTMTVFY